jgi:glycosyltransferase involved in cell wall biosynthesis
MRPLVSVILPCYNAEKYLAYSLESVLSQHYSNLEVICINDGSHDATLSILQDYGSADTRIRVVNNLSNLGLIASLNLGLSLARGAYFARMDADDYCPPDRINKQMQFIEENPDYDLVSSGYHYFSVNDKTLEYVPPIGTHPASLKFASLFSTPLTHASTLGRIGLVRSGLYQYDQRFPHSEDYELFSRLAMKNVQLGNLRESLYWVRLNPESVSVIYNDVQITSHLAITKRNLLLFGVDRSRLTEPILKLLSNRINSLTQWEDLKSAFEILDDCFLQYQRSSTLEKKTMKEISNYLVLHKLNVLIQSNKTGFKKCAFSNFTFFVKTLTLLEFRQIPHLSNKFFVYLKYRIF